MYNQFIIIFALILTGLLLRRYNIIDEAMNNGINKLIMLVALPCLVIHKMGAIEADGELMKEFLLCVAITLLAMLLCGGYAKIYAKARKFPENNSNVAEFSMVTPNNAFMGFPIASLFFGEMGLLMMIGANVAMNIYMFTYGIVLLERKKEEKSIKPQDAIKALIKKLSNPIMASLIIGFIICIGRIVIPTPIDLYLQQVGSLCTPLSMIYIGSNLAGSSFTKIIKDRVIVETTLNKLITIPIITFVVTYCISLCIALPFYVTTAIILSSAFPTAAMVSILAQQKEQDVKLAGEILFLTTAGSAITLLPIITTISKIFA